jgi:hypothetical protein
MVIEQNKPNRSLVIALRIHVHNPMQRQALQLPQIIYIQTKPHNCVLMQAVTPY